MRHLVYLVATSVDGYITTQPREDPRWLALDGPHNQDLLREFPEMMPGHLRDAVGIAPGTVNARFDTVIMGRHTYDIGRAVGVTSPYPHLQQIVVSETLQDAPDPAIHVVDRDPLGYVRQLKQERERDIWLCGGGALAGTLYEEIDELILKVVPAVLGAGVPLFGRRVGPQMWTMSQHRVYDNGFCLLRYRRPSSGST